MKKLIPLLLFIILAKFAAAQNTVSLPAGYYSPGAPSYMAVGTLTDSLAKRYFLKFTGGGYNEIYTATFLNKNFLRKLDSLNFVTPWQFLHGNNRITGKNHWTDSA